MSYIGTQPTPQSLESRQEFTATASQTTFATSGYTVGYVDVYLNGVKLSTSDFTATNGSDVVLGSGAAAGDVLAVVMKNDHSDLVALPITDSQGNNVLSESGSVVTLQNTRVWRTDILHVSGWYDGSSYQAPLYGGELDRIAPMAYLNNTGEKAFFHWYIPDDCNEIDTIDIIWYQAGNPTSANQGELNFTTRVVINQGYTSGTNTSATVNLGYSTNGNLRKVSVAGSTLLPTQTSGNYIIFEAEFGFSIGSAGSYGWMVGSLVINWR
jgi:hypothetical protein